MAGWRGRRQGCKGGSATYLRAWAQRLTLPVPAMLMPTPTPGRPQLLIPFSLFPSLVPTYHGGYWATARQTRPLTPSSPLPLVFFSQIRFRSAGSPNLLEP